MDETYVRVAGKWAYLYRALDSEGNTIDFMLSPYRDRMTAKHFPKADTARAISWGGAEVASADGLRFVVPLACRMSVRIPNTSATRVA